MDNGVPVIDTPRLRLRGHAVADLEARIVMTGDPVVMRFLGGVAQSREENWARIQRYAGHWALLGHGLFAVQERDGAFIGEVGLARFERGFGPDFDTAPEAAWIFATRATGRGLAREAVAAAIAWHEGRFGRSRMVCVIGADNAPSLRLAGHLGFTAFRTLDYHGRPAILHERLPLPPGDESR